MTKNICPVCATRRLSEDRYCEKCLCDLCEIDYQEGCATWILKCLM